MPPSEGHQIEERWLPGLHGDWVAGVTPPSWCGPQSTQAAAVESALKRLKGLVWCGLLFVLEISLRVCGMLFSGVSLYFRASLKAVYPDTWLVLAGEIQFVWLMDFPVSSSFLA